MDYCSSKLYEKNDNWTKFNELLLKYFFLENIDGNAIGISFMLDWALIASCHEFIPQYHLISITNKFSFRHFSHLKRNCPFDCYFVQISGRSNNEKVIIIIKMQNVFFLYRRKGNWHFYFNLIFKTDWDNLFINWMNRHTKLQLERSKLIG